MYRRMKRTPRAESIEKLMKQMDRPVRGTTSCMNLLAVSGLTFTTMEAALECAEEQGVSEDLLFRLRQAKQKSFELLSVIYDIDAEFNPQEYEQSLVPGGGE